MGELRSAGDQQRQQPQPPLPSAPQAVLSVMVEPYALPYDHHRHHQQSPAADQCYGEHYRQQQINIPNALAYGAPATPYPGHPRQMVTNSIVTDHCPVGEDKHSDVDGRLPFCGLGIGWFLFILGFLLAFPWFFGIGFLLFSKHDNREKPGFLACTVLAVIFVVLVVFDATRPVYHAQL